MINNQNNDNHDDSRYDSCDYKYDLANRIVRSSVSSFDHYSDTSQGISQVEPLKYQYDTKGRTVATDRGKGK
jgi:hypothetical protein